MSKKVWLSLHSSQVTHPTGAYFSFSGMKYKEVSDPPPWDGMLGPSQATPRQFVSLP